MTRLAAPRARWVVVLGLCVLVVAAMGLRRRFVLSLFADGPPGAAPKLTPASAEAPGLPKSARVRVLLLDGLGAAPADTMPGLGSLCADGIDLRVDTGFPTVSLPVQHVLWTGRTQAQSGVWYRIPRLPQPPADALPQRVPGSVAVAQSHPDIVRSFGFDRVLDGGEAGEPEGSAWRREGFMAAAIEAVAGSAPLVFVHVLAIDEAGHAQGGASAAYEAAVDEADEQLARLREAAGSEAAGSEPTWIVLADHGHRPGGGHGGAEPEIRVVRACVVGPGIAAADHRDGPPIHLVDLHRGLAEALGVAPGADAAGRPLAFALEHPDPDATLPRPSPERWLAAGLLLLAGLWTTARCAGLRLRAWPLWLGLAYASLVLIEGQPTLSHPMVYAPYGRDVLLAASPGAALLAIAAVLGLRREGLAPTVLAQGALPLALMLASLTLCGWPLHAPPLLPGWTAHGSVACCLVALGAASLAIAIAAVSLRR